MEAGCAIAYGLITSLIFVLCVYYESTLAVQEICQAL